MASVHETEQDSDEDCEVYFLKPVNEYNIVDKIKEANQELFADADAEDGDELVSENQINRKVSFAPNLEEYEPKNGINLKELHEILGAEIAEENLTNSEGEQKLEIITEEEDDIKDNITSICQDTEIAHEEEQSSTDMNNEETNDEFEKDTVVEQASCDKGENVDENEILEEICEEIQIMDMENDKLEASKETAYDSPIIVQRKILKQITFDCTEEDESDNKSLTNLLISDNEICSDEEEPEYQEYNCNEPVNDDTNNEDNKYSSTNNVYYDEEEEDDDDKLSIIVSSYLADDIAYDKTCFSSSSLKCSPRISKSRKLPFNKRFSFRRKAKSSNAIASSSNHHLSSSNRRFIPPPEVTDLKLHYKTCCEYKNSQLQKLPKYTGYISEYGLSREQLLEREHKLQQKQRGKTIETLKNSEADIRKMHDNERAFTTWLKNKMRFPINKTRNMFDVKRPFGLRKCTSVGGNALLNDDSKLILGTTKYRSISAKFRKS